MSKGETFNGTIDRNDVAPDLSIDLLGVRYNSPLVVASGTLVETYDQIAPYVEAGAGAVIPRSTRLEMVRTVHPSPHLHQAGVGRNADMINGEWTGADIDYWKPYLLDMSEQGKVIMSVSGRDISGCIKVCKELDQYDFPLIEVNISCGVSNGVHGYITRNSEHIRELVEGLKHAGVTTPISIKLGHSDGIVELAGVAKESGADAVTAVNTYGPVLDFNIEADGTPRRVVGAEGAKGGLSGNSLFYTALTDVAEISRQIEVPVLASGGVMTPERAAKMIMAGAYLVQLYTVLHISGIEAPSAMKKFDTGFRTYLSSHGISSVESVRGAALPLMKEETELAPQIPFVDASKCIGCDLCVQVCLPDAFKKVPANNRTGHVVEVDEPTCVGCGHCMCVCPVDGALKLPSR